MTSRPAGRRLAACLAAAVTAALWALPAHAESITDRIDVHGYGNQNYESTSANTYRGADRHGTWDNNFVGLVMAATLTDESKFWAQFQGSTNEGTRFTWFFIDYQLNDRLRLHAGRVKLPLGFYNDSIDVKALQLSALEPILYQTFRTGPDMVHDAYQGIGADYEQETGIGHLLWQVWGGNVYDTDPPDDSRDRQAVGARLTYSTPVDGLRFMLSAYRTRVELLEDGSYTNEDRVIGSVEFVRGPWDIKSEYAEHRAALHAGGGMTKADAWYVQAGYTFAEKWTPYARYDYFCADKAECGDPAAHQKTVALGLGYRLAPNIGLRLETHINRGYAVPVASEEANAGTGESHWNQYIAAVNFLF